MNHPYTLPTRENGKQLKARNIKFEEEFYQAIKQFADRESAAYGIVISPATLLQSFTTKGDPAIRAKNAEFGKLYKSIKEKSHHDRERANPTPSI